MLLSKVKNVGIEVVAVVTDQGSNFITLHSLLDITTKGHTFGTWKQDFLFV